MRISKVLRRCVVIFGCLYAQLSMGADVFYLGYEQGEFEVDQANYPKTDITSLSIGATNNEYTLQLNGYELDDVSVADAVSAHREIEGYSLQLGKVIQLSKMLKLGVSYGRFWWETRDVMNGIQIDKQSGADRLLEAQLSINFNKAALYISRKQMRDVNGSDLEVTALGLRYFFE